MTIAGSARSDGNIELLNSSEVCGHATPGLTGSVSLGSSGSVCPGFSTARAPGQLVLPPVAQGNAPTVNDNARICALDPCTSRSQITWEPTLRRLSLRNSSSITLGGSVYSFCQLELRNSTSLIIPVKAPGTAVRIYIDAPENCPGVASAGRFTMANSAQVVNLNGDPVTLQVYVVGSAAQDAPVSLANSNTMAFALYAPNSTVTLANSVRVRGAIAANRVVLGNSVRIDYAESIGTLRTQTILPIYRRQQYRECAPSPPAGGMPSAGC